MSLPEFSVRRPIFVTMFTLIVVILGAVSLSRLRIDLLPNIELPTVTVRTEYEGASPEVMERLVTQIIEEIVGTVPGVEEVTSQSSEGNSRIRVSFVWGTDVDTAALDVLAKLEDEINELPEDVVRPRVAKFDIASFPVVLLGISSNLDPVELTQLIEDQIRYRFAHIPGVAQVDVWGGYNREVRIELDPDRINALQLPLDRVLVAIRDANLDLPAGQIEQGRYEVTLRAPAEFANLDQIRNTVILQRNGSPVTLGQIAGVTDTYEKLTRIVRVNGGRGIRVAIRKQADANTVEVSRRILSEIDKVNEAYPQIRIVPVINQGNFIERSIKNVAQSVLYGGGLAILVLLFFLRNFRSTLVISLAIPISVIATFALVYFGGFTLNLMTLGGLALGVGMMVDSSIVVLENIFRRRTEAGDSPSSAAVEGTREVGPAIIASTITTLVIFLPVIFVRGVSGILFKEMAYVIIFSLSCSLLVSLSLVPMLSAGPLAIQEQRTRKRSAWIERWDARADKFFRNLENGYRDLIRWVLSHRLQTVLFAAAILGASLLLIPFIGTEFLPPSDEGEVRVTGEMEVGTRLELVDEQTQRMERIVYAAVPEAVSSVVSVGATGWNPAAASQGQINLALSPATKRDRSNVEIADDLRQRLTGNIPGMDVRTRAPQGQFLLDRLLGADEGLTIEIRGFDLFALDALANRAAAAIRDVKGITDIDTSREPRQGRRPGLKRSGRHQDPGNRDGRLQGRRVPGPGQLLPHSREAERRRETVAGRDPQPDSDHGNRRTGSAAKRRHDRGKPRADPDRPQGPAAAGERHGQRLGTRHGLRRRGGAGTSNRDSPPRRVRPSGCRQLRRTAEVVPRTGDLARVGACPGVHGARLPIRVFAGPPGRHGVRPGGRDRCASHPVPDAHYAQPAVVHRVHHAGGDRRQQRDSPRGPGRSADKRRDERPRCGGRSGPPPAAADPDDDAYDRARPTASGVGHRRRGGRPGPAGPCRRRRSHGVDADHAGADSGGLLPVSP
jgi:HAE1 family hydrophobic/amphiphilic exporter-1